MGHGQNKAAGPCGAKPELVFFCAVISAQDMPAIAVCHGRATWWATANGVARVGHN